MGIFYFYFSFSLFTWYLWQLLPRGQTRQGTGQNILWYSKAGVHTYIYITSVCLLIWMYMFDMQQLHSPASLWSHLTQVSPNFPFSVSSSMFDLISYLWDRLAKFVIWQDCWPWDYGQASHVPRLLCLVLLERNPEFGPSQRQHDELMLSMLCPEGHTRPEVMEQLQE